MSDPTDRFGGDEAWDVHCRREDEERERELASAECTQCVHCETFDVGTEAVYDAFLRLTDCCTITAKVPGISAGDLVSDALNACLEAARVRVCKVEAGIADIYQVDPRDTPKDLGCESYSTE